MSESIRTEAVRSAWLLCTTISFRRTARRCGTSPAALGTTRRKDGSGRSSISNAGSAPGRLSVQLVAASRLDADSGRLGRGQQRDRAAQADVENGDVALRCALVVDADHDLIPAEQVRTASVERLLNVVCEQGVFEGHMPIELGLAGPGGQVPQVCGASELPEIRAEEVDHAVGHRARSCGEGLALGVEQAHAAAV